MKFSHCLIVWIKESVLKWNWSLNTASEMSHSYSLSYIMSMWKTSKNIDSFWWQSLLYNWMIWVKLIFSALRYIIRPTRMKYSEFILHTWVHMSGQCATVVKWSSPGGIKCKDETSWPTVNIPESYFLNFEVRWISIPLLSTTFSCNPGLS